MADREKQIYYERIKLVYSHAPTPSVITLIVGVLMCSILWEVSTHTHILIWLAIIFGISIFRLSLYSLFHSKKPREEKIGFWGAMFIVSIVMHGVSWGIASVTLPPGDSLLYQVIFLLWIVGFAGAAVSLYSGYPKAVFAFVIPALLPVVIVFAISGETLKITLSAYIVAYIAIVTVLTYNIYRSITERLSLNLQMKNEIENNRRSQGTYQSLLNAMSEGILIYENGVISDVNPSMMNILGFKQEEIAKVINTSIFDFLVEKQDSKVMKSLRGAIESPDVSMEPTEYKARKTDGSLFDIEVCVKPHIYQGREVSLVSVIDITRRKDIETELLAAKGETEQVNKKLEEANREFATIIDNLQDVFYRADMDGIFTWMSPSGEAVFGYTEEEITGSKVADLYMNPKDRLQFMVAMKTEGGIVHNYETQVRHKKGYAVWISTNAHYYKNNNGEIAGVEGTVRDITDRKRLESELREMSFVDGLTGLANRRYFDEVIKREWARAQRNKSVISLIMIDIDFFKPYNDTYGHQKGDTALIDVCKVILESIRRPGDIAARYGGEELAVILPYTEAENVFSIAEKIRKNILAIEIPHEKSEVTNTNFLSISLGTSTMRPERDTEHTILIEKADKALYLAKHQGRNRAVAD